MRRKLRDVFGMGPGEHGDLQARYPEGAPHTVPKESGMQGRKAGKPPKGAVQLVVSMELLSRVPPQSGDRI